MSATSYYSTKARVGARTERIRGEMDKSSAYILEGGSLNSSNYSSKPSYSSSTMGRQGSFREDSSRTGRSRVRDTSVDYSSRASQRSSSVDYSAPIKYRARDHSVDYSTYTKPTYTSTNRAPRPVTINFDDDDEHSPEYRKIMEKNDVHLTLGKYSKKDEDAVKVDGMMEEERRSKAYSKIINQSNSSQMEKDAYRSTMADLFADTRGFSAKTINAINKEWDKEDKRPKNYSWRKDIESYEETLEKMSAHKRNVRESTRATNDESGTKRYRDTNTKVRDYDRECRRDVDSESSTVRGRITVSATPTINRKSEYEYTPYKPPETTYTNGISSHTNGISSNNESSYNNRTSSYTTNENDRENSKPPKGSWRKDMEAYEENLAAKKTIRNTETKEEPSKTYSWQKASSTTENTAKVATSSTTSTSTSKYTAKTTEEKPVTGNIIIKIEDAKVADTPRWKKPEPVVEDKPKPVETTKKTNSEIINVPIKVAEAKPAESKPTPSWKKPEPAKVEDPKPVESKPSPVVKQVEVKKVEEPKDSPKTVPKWKKPEPAKTEEVKPVETPKATPKWKKPEPAKKTEEEKVSNTNKTATEKKEEPKAAETPKPAPKWKKPEAPKPVEAKPEEPQKPVPKWKKQTPAVKKEEEKPAETPKPAPKWKKPETAKKEEPKPAEPEKPVPKWKKPEAAKKEEPKPAEPEKPIPKWKKPEAAKKEEPKPAEPEKPVPKWKKPETAKKEEPKPAEPEKPVPKWKKPAAAKKEEPVPEPAAPEPEPVEEVKPVVVDESRLNPEPETEAAKTVETKEESKQGEAEGEKKEGEEEEEEDNHGMKAMAKEQHTKFSAMDEEFAAGASKLSALRAKMKALRMKHKAAADADAAAEAGRQG